MGEEGFFFPPYCLARKSTLPLPNVYNFFVVIILSVMVVAAAIVALANLNDLNLSLVIHKIAIQPPLPVP